MFGAFARTATFTRNALPSRVHRASSPRPLFASCHLTPLFRTYTTYRVISVTPTLPPAGRPSYLRPILFTVVVSTLSFYTAAITDVQKLITTWQRLELYLKPHENRSRTLLELTKAQKEYFHDKLRERIDRIERLNLPEEFRRAYILLVSRWASLKESEKTMLGIIAINTVVFVGWKIPQLRPFMSRWFMHHPLSGRSITLLTSCFSHQELWHFGLNMVALWSFGGLVHDALGREQFLAFYLTTGMSASLVSHLLTLRFRPRADVLPSLGASGAIYGCLAATAVHHPKASVMLIFFPFIPIQIG